MLTDTQEARASPKQGSMEVAQIQAPIGCSPALQQQRQQVLPCAQVHQGGAHFREQVTRSNKIGAQLGASIWWIHRSIALAGLHIFMSAVLQDADFSPPPLRSDNQGPDSTGKLNEKG